MKAAGKAPVPVHAAGGIVMRDAPEPLVAIVRLRKSKAWVLPKGKLKPGEDAIAAARREVKEETGHDVSVHEFLGSMANSTGNRHKIVQFWRMQAVGGQVSELMSDVKAVKWLPLPQAIDALTHAHERVFLEHVGPVALAAAAHSKHDVPGPSAERLIGEEVAHPVRRTLIDLIRAWLRRLPWTVSARTP